MPDDSNVRVVINDDDILTITIDLKRRLGPSAAMRKDPSKGNLLIAYTPRGTPLVNPDGTYRKETLSVHCWIAEPHPVTQTENLLKHAMNIEMDPKIRDVLELVLQSVEGYPAMFRKWLKGELDMDRLIKEDG